MKRIENACLEQTLVFSLKDKGEPDRDREWICQEYHHYKRQLEKKKIAYQVLAEEALPDGTLRIRIRKQYNHYPCDAYLG